MIVVMLGLFLQEEQAYLTGEQSVPRSKSFLEEDTISHTSVVFSIVLVVCASCGIFASLLLIYGLYKDQRALLVPWIFTVIIVLIVDLANNIYMFILETSKFNPMTAILFTLDFFLMCLNIYSLLCVISQYQEYRAGRGTVQHERFIGRIPAVRYAARPTATSCLSTRRAPTYAAETKTSPTQSPTAPLSTLIHEDSTRSPNPRSSSFSCGLGPPVSTVHVKKHVQFPDETLAERSEDGDTPSGDVECGAVLFVVNGSWSGEVVGPISNPKQNVTLKANDTIPLIVKDPPSNASK